MARRRDQLRGEPDRHARLAATLARGLAGGSTATALLIYIEGAEQDQLRDVPQTGMPGLQPLSLAA